MLEITEGEAIQSPKEFTRLLDRIEVIAEGVDTIGEYQWFRRVGVRLFQGYLLRRPGFESLEAPVFPS